MRSISKRRAGSFARNVDAIEVERDDLLDIREVEVGTDAAQEDLGRLTLLLEACRRDQGLHGAKIDDALFDEAFAGHGGNRCCGLLNIFRPLFGRHDDFAQALLLSGLLGRPGRLRKGSSMRNDSENASGQDTS